jgi:subtilisin-like proprotein convertase family protein
LCSGVIVAAGTFCRAETLLVGEDFTNRIPAEDSGKAFMDNAVLAVPQHAVITDLDVYLDITHENVIDLIINLYSPTGQSIELKDNTLMGLYSPEEDPWPNMYGTIFDDEVSMYMSDVQSPYTGRFRPDGGVLSVFDGRDAYGDWTLEIYDMAYGDVGTLDRWELQFEVIDTPEPSTLCYLGILAGFYFGKRNKRAPAVSAVPKKHA